MAFSLSTETIDYAIELIKQSEQTIARFEIINFSGRIRGNDDGEGGRNKGKGREQCVVSFPGPRCLLF